MMWRFLLEAIIVELVRLAIELALKALDLFPHG